ncbi:MAG: DNA repair protein RadA [Deltaproteobacteria bacterium]|nr:DNA repair protein RadA [Deltaproteobacteria bacterium]
MAKLKSQPYICSSCHTSYAKWMGRCTECGELNTVSEVVSITTSGRSTSAPVRLVDVKDIQNDEKKSTHLDFLNRLVGDGIPTGTAILLAGEPGIGKSTLLFQMMAQQSESVLYVSAEESVQQISRRFKSFPSKNSDQLFIISENHTGRVLEHIDALKPEVVVIDSIQMMMTDSEDRVKGGVASLKEITEALVNRAKERGFILWIVGHVNKDGDIAGPKTLEHLVDTVLIFSMAEDSRLRILQTQKNRFGPSGELALLEMDEKGLREKQEGDSYWVHQRDQGVAGCAISSILFGSRVLSVEIQALVVDSYFPSPRRSTSGFEFNRLYLLLAVLEKRLKIPFGKMDVYLNVVGGLKISDPGADLAVAAALVSAHSEKPIPKQTIFCGEIGLTGELRPVAALKDRIRSASQSHPKARFLTSSGVASEVKVKEGFQVKGFDSLEKALQSLS